MKQPRVKLEQREEFRMPDLINRMMVEVTETVDPLMKQVGKQLEGLQDAISIHPSDGEIEEALGQKSSLAERDAYRLGHESGWQKGALMFGCAVLAGLAVISFAISGESRRN
jgi:hypothetical protein